MTQSEHICAICCLPEVAGDAIVDENAKTTEGHALLYFEAANVSSFRWNQNQAFA